MITSAIRAPWIARSNVCAPNSARLRPKPIASSRCAGWDIGSAKYILKHKGHQGLEGKPHALHFVTLGVLHGEGFMQTIRARLSVNYLLVLVLGMTLAGVLA